MVREFCPRSEVKNLETELSVLAPHQVDTLERTIEKYIYGLPPQIQDFVFSSKPETLEEAMELAGTLSENHVKAGTLTRKGGKKVVDKPESSATPKLEPKSETKSAGPSSSTSNAISKKRKNQNFAIVNPTNIAPTYPQFMHPTYPQFMNPTYPQFMNPTYPQPMNPNPPQPPQRKIYTGPHPLCPTCKFHHAVTMPCRLCTNCNQYGHVNTMCRYLNSPQITPATPPANPVTQANASRAPAPSARNPALGNPQTPATRACYQCGDLTHMRNQCPLLLGQANVPVPRGRAFNINMNQAQANNDVVNGTFLINQRYASILFDSGADRSFVSLEFESLLDKPRSNLGEPITVEVANGEPIELKSIIRDCALDLKGHLFPVDLIPMHLGSFDVILGMDWLALHHAEILCFEKSIRIPLPSGDLLKI